MSTTDETLERKLDGNDAVSSMLSPATTPLIDESDVEDLADDDLLDDDDLEDISFELIEVGQKPIEWIHTEKHKEETRKLTRDISYLLNDINDRREQRWESVISARELKIFSDIYTINSHFSEIEEMIDSYLLGPELKKTSIATLSNLRLLSKTNAQLASAAKKKINEKSIQNDPLKIIFERTEQISKYLQETYGRNSEAGRKVVSDKRQSYVLDAKKLVEQDPRINRIVKNWNSFKMGKEDEAMYFRRMTQAIISTIHFSDGPHYLNADTMLEREDGENDVSFYRRTALQLAQTRLKRPVDESNVTTRKDYETIIRSVMVSNVLIPDLRSTHDYISKTHNPFVADATAYIMLKDWIVNNTDLKPKAKNALSEMLVNFNFSDGLDRVIEKNKVQLRDSLHSLNREVVGIYSSVSTMVSRERLTEVVDDLRYRIDLISAKLY